MADEERYRAITPEADCRTGESPSALFRRLKHTGGPLEGKVGYILRRYGWHEKRNVPSAELCKALEEGGAVFPGGIRFVQQFDGLLFPGKRTLSRQGSHIQMRFMRRAVLGEGLSHHFGERVLSIGVERSFDGYDENPVQCWEDVSIPPDTLDYDEVELFLGQSGRIYWFCYDGDSMGLAGKDALEFFAVRFSLLDDPYHLTAPSVWSAEDRKAMRSFQEKRKERFPERG